VHQLSFNAKTKEVFVIQNASLFEVKKYVKEHHKYKPIMVNVTARHQLSVILIDLSVKNTM
jgi:hypothetical protein